MNRSVRFLSRLSRVLVVALCVLATAWVADARSKFNAKLSVGDAAPEWGELPGDDGKPHALSDFKEAKVLVVLFTGSHCPMTKVYAQRVQTLAARFAEKNVAFVAINVDRKGTDKTASPTAGAAFSFPVLRDVSQQSARAYGATVTPQFFVLDEGRKIVCMGAFDDNAREEKVEKHFVADAVSAVLEGRAPPVKESLARGCEIRYAPAPADERK
jgi:peroxiredoxin